MKLTEKETEILEILDENSRVDAETIAKMANIPAEEVKSIIEKLEKEKVIIDYAAMIDWRKVDGLEGVTAMIDVKVTPKRNVGFDEVAERIYRFQEVESVYLMSGCMTYLSLFAATRCQTWQASCLKNCPPLSPSFPRRRTLS